LDLIKKAEDAQIIIPAMSKIGENIFKKAFSLRLVQQWGTGLDGVDIKSATRYQVAVANVPTVGSGNAESVAEWYVMAALGLSRRVCEIRSQVSKGYPWGSPVGQALYGRTVGRWHRRFTSVVKKNRLFVHLCSSNCRNQKYD